VEKEEVWEGRRKRRGEGERYLRSAARDGVEAALGL